LTGDALPLPPLAGAQDPAQQLPQEPPAPNDQQQDTRPGDAGQEAQKGARDPSNAANQPGAGDPRTLQALADALRDQGATRSAADALDRGDLPGAAQARQDGQQGQSQGQGNSPGGAGNGPAGEQRQSQPNSRLNVEGQAVPLESSGDGQVPAQPSGKPPTTAGAGGNAGFTQGDASSG